MDEIQEMPEMLSVSQRKEGKSVSGFMSNKCFFEVARMTFSPKKYVRCVVRMAWKYFGLLGCDHVK